jgi:hypothetical protein
MRGFDDAVEDFVRDRIGFITTFTAMSLDKTHGFVHWFSQKHEFATDELDSV